MKISACLTINERKTPVLDAMFGSLREQPFDEMVAVFDRAPREVYEHSLAYWFGDKRFRAAVIDGPRGWRSPVPAWNRAFAEATGDAIFAFSSEMVHAPENVARARAMLADDPECIVFGKAQCSCGPAGCEVEWGGTAPGNLLVDAAHARPLGFIWAGMRAPVRAIGGMDMGFAGGFWFDDDDFFYRLWRTGADFVFTDDISGVHLHHERPVLATPKGQAGIARNQAHMLAKHGTVRPFDGVTRIVTTMPGLTRWSHP